MANVGSPTREKGKRAGANAPPTPKVRDRAWLPRGIQPRKAYPLSYPPIVESRLRAAGIRTQR